MTVWRAVLATAVLALATLVPVRPAGAAPILAAEDAVELANKLAEATAEQEVCYGWEIQVYDESGSGSGLDQGSSLGPDRSARDPACSPQVVFVAEIVYTSEMSESPDRATYSVESDLPGFDASDLGVLGVSEQALLGDNDDLAVLNATALLPVLVAEQGLAPPVPVEETTGTIPAADRPTGAGGSDRIRTYGALYVLAGLLVAAGVVWLVAAVAIRRAQDRNPDFALSDLFED